MAFREDLEKAQKELNVKLNKILRTSAIKCFNNIIQKSPVGNIKLWKTAYPPKGYTGGTFRANWIATVNTPFNGVMENGPVDNVASKLANGSVTDILYLTNNLPYAERIENGWSQQAPSGWVRTAVQNAQNSIDKIVADIS